MNIAVVGRGLAGLAVGWHLLRLGCQVTFLDEKELGCSASGVAAGLMHPYAGDKARRRVLLDKAGRSSLIATLPTMIVFCEAETELTVKEAIIF